MQHIEEIDIVGRLLPHLLHMIADFVTYKGGTVPPLLQGLMAVGDALAGVANMIKTFAIFAFSISGVISKLASFVDQSLKEIMVSALPSAGSVTTSFLGMRQDVINQQVYGIDNVWTPQQIIDHYCGTIIRLCPMTMEKAIVYNVPGEMMGACSPQDIS